MSIQGILAISLIISAQQAFTRYTRLNVNLNLSAYISDENNHLSEDMIRICMKETQLSMAELEKFKTNEILDSEANESIQCFTHCIYEQMGVMKSGLFVDNDDTLKLDAENPEFAVCRSIQGSNKCDSAYKIHQCIQKVKYGVRDQPQGTNPNTMDNGSDDDDSIDSENGQ